jgi:uncharacterized membrane protein YgcG
MPWHWSCVKGEGSYFPFIPFVMKFRTRFFSFAFLVIGFSALAPTVQAQVNVNVQVGAPAWGPPVPAGVQYYYIPEIDGYYDIYNGVYLVFRDGYWVTLPTLNGYDPYAFHPVAVYYQGPQPWQYVVQDRSRYGRPLIGASPNWNHGHVYGYSGRDHNFNGPGRSAPAPQPGNNGGGRFQPGNNNGGPGSGNPGGGRGNAGSQGGHFGGGGRSGGAQGGGRRGR